MTLDRNKTVWQRLDTVLRDHGVGGNQLEELTIALHRHIVDERRDAHSIGVNMTLATARPTPADLYPGPVVPR